MTTPNTSLRPRPDPLGRRGELMSRPSTMLTVGETTRSARPRFPWTRLALGHNSRLATKGNWGVFPVGRALGSTWEQHDAHTEHRAFRGLACWTDPLAAQDHPPRSSSLVVDYPFCSPLTRPGAGAGTLNGPKPGAGVPVRWSKALIPTLKETPADAVAPSHVLLLRAGMIRQLGAGAYTYLPLGFRVLNKVVNIIRQEMDAAVACPRVVDAARSSRSEPEGVGAGTKLTATC